MLQLVAVLIANTAQAGSAPALACDQPVRVCAERAINDGRPAEAIKLLQAAAEKGDTDAMRAIGMLHIEGVGVAQDPEAGVGWIYEAAMRGDKVAMRLLGEAFRDGLGVKPDRKLAAYWANRARN